MSTILERILTKHIDKFAQQTDTVWTNLTKNLNISLKFIFEHVDTQHPINTNYLNHLRHTQHNFTFYSKCGKYKWLLTNLIEREDITIDFITAHPEYPWCWNYIGLALADKLTIDFIEKNINKLPNYNLVNNLTNTNQIKNQINNLTNDNRINDKYYDYNISYGRFFSHAPLESIKDFIAKYGLKDARISAFKYEFVPLNDALDWETLYEIYEIIRENMYNEFKHMVKLSPNYSCIDIEMLEEFIEMGDESPVNITESDGELLSKNPNITWDFVEKYKTNPKITFDWKICRYIQTFRLTSLWRIRMNLRISYRHWNIIQT